MPKYKREAKQERRKINTKKGTASNSGGAQTGKEQRGFQGERELSTLS